MLRKSIAGYDMASIMFYRVSTIARFDSLPSRMIDHGKRNHEIIALFRKGWIMEDIAYEYDLTKQRVSQILQVYDVDRTEGGKAKEIADRPPPVQRVKIHTCRKCGYRSAIAEDWFIIKNGRKHPGLYRHVGCWRNKKRSEYGSDK
jgi:hypothetical protein